MPEDFAALVAVLAAMPRETQTVEFKMNNSNPERIGQYISGLANAAALEGAENAYAVWGIDDATHAIVGTSFQPEKKRVGAQELELWLSHTLTPNASFRFSAGEVGGRRVVLLRVAPAASHPVTFKGKAYIRVGSALRELKAESAESKRLWRVLDGAPMELRPASQWHTEGEALNLLDWRRYYAMTGIPIPSNAEETISQLAKEQILTRHDSGQWAVTTIGALMFAHDLGDFTELASRSIRIVRYLGTRRTAQTQRHVLTSGYAAFEEALAEILAHVPATETIEGALRKGTPAFPTLAIRELLANALIHQDLAIYGAGPLVEVFEDRIEFSNPGTSLVADNRLVNDPPRSRNRILAGLARRLGICEEAGSGWDKIVDSLEAFHLPAPTIVRNEDPANPAMRITLTHYRPFAALSAGERTDAAYWHGCVQYANNDFLTNASLRERFGLPRSAGAASQVSRVIRDAVAQGLIKPRDPHASRKNMSYIPGWA